MQFATSALLGLLFMTGTATADASSTPPAPEYTVNMTAYNAVPAQTSDHPDITASGAFSNPSIVAARSQDLASELPFGTVIEVEAATTSLSCGYDAVGQDIGLRVIADTMNARWKNRIDILMPTNGTGGGETQANPAYVLGLCTDVTIKIVGHIDVASIPKTQAELAAALESSGQVADSQ